MGHTTIPSGHLLSVLTVCAADDYRSGGYAESFVAHLALRAASASSIVERLKLIMLLQGSVTLDATALLERLQREELLLYERAVLLGKVCNL